MWIHQQQQPQPPAPPPPQQSQPAMFAPQGFGASGTGGPGMASSSATSHPGIYLVGQQPPSQMGQPVGMPPQYTPLMMGDPQQAPQHHAQHQPAVMPAQATPAYYYQPAGANLSSSSSAMSGSRGAMGASQPGAPHGQWQWGVPPGGQHGVTPGVGAPVQYFAAPQQQQQQQQQQPQIVLLPNGQYAILQPAPMAGGPFAPPSGGPFPTVSIPSGGLALPQVVTGAPRFNASSTHSPGHSITGLPAGSGIGTPNASTTRAAGQMGGSTSTSSRPLCDTAVWGFAIVDPYHPTLQRVPVPPSAVVPTKGVKAYNNDVSASSTKPCASILCMRHVGGGQCPLDDQCHNFHVRADYVEAARALSEPLCCGLHNDYFTREMIRGRCAPHVSDSKFTLVLEDRSEVDLMPSQLAFTIGLDHLSIRGQSRVINAKKQVCRLHLEGRCKWTKDCGHVHLCRELHRFLGQFHFPSLVFLLSTETDPAKLRAKLAEVQDFVRSRTCLPLTSQLIAAGRGVAVACLAEHGAVFTQAMAAAARAELQFEPPATQVLPSTDFANEVIRRAAAPKPAVEPAATTTPSTGAEAAPANATPPHAMPETLGSPAGAPSTSSTDAPTIHGV